MKLFLLTPFLMIINFFFLFGGINEISSNSQENIHNPFEDFPTILENIHYNNSSNPVFKPNRLFLVDHTKNNFLFRGNIPINKDTVAYEELIETIKTRAKDNNLVLDDNFKLTVLCLLNSFTDSYEIEILKKFFKEYPEKGRIFMHPIYGEFLNPCFTEEPLKNYLIIDRIPQLMTRIYDRMTKNSSRQHVLYVHCYSGRDRTGEVSACYLMQYKDQSYKSVMEINERIAKKKLRELSVNAIRLYAKYLCDNEKITSIGSVCE